MGKCECIYLFTSVYRFFSVKSPFGNIILKNFNFFSFFLKFYFIFKLDKIVLVLPNIKMNLPQVYMSPSWTLLPPPSPYHPSGLSQCTSPKHPVSCIKPGLATRFIHDIIHVSMPFSQIFPPSPSPTEPIKANNINFTGLLWGLNVLLVVVQSLSRVLLFVTPWTITCQTPLFMGFSRQEC